MDKKTFICSAVDKKGNRSILELECFNEEVARKILEKRNLKPVHFWKK